MINAAEVITRAVAAKPVHDALVAVAGAHVVLTDPAQQEDLVVHRQPEEDGEHDHRQERADRHVVVDTEQTAAPSPLEHGDDHAVGGADGQQVHDSCLERNQDRAEHHHQQQERQEDDGADEQWQT
jgi:hypothetical protein